MPYFFASASLITAFAPPAFYRSCIEIAIGSSTPSKFSLTDTDVASELAPAALFLGTLAVTGRDAVVVGFAMRDLAALPAFPAADFGPFAPPSIRSTKIGPF